MAVTDKQARNGVPGPEGSRGPESSVDVSGVVSSMKGQAESAADDRVSEAAQFLSSGQGSGPGPSSSPTSPDRQLGAAGDMWEWDSGLAVSEQRGEA